MTIKIKSGIYQGDSLSPLVFCLALAPLSSLLNKSNIALDVNTIIRDLEQDGTYKYTGVSEGDGGRGIPVQHSQIDRRSGRPALSDKRENPEKVLPELPHDPDGIQV